MQIVALIPAIYRYSLLPAFIVALTFLASSAGAEEGPTKEALAIGAATGTLMESALRADGFAPPPEETPAPAPTVAPTPAVTPTPGPARGNCPEGQYELAPGVCIGKRDPTVPSHPRDLEFKLCFKIGETRICQPGYFDCKTDKHGVTTCKLRIIMPPFIPDVKCDFTPAPDGGAKFECSFPDPSSPTDKKTLPGKITFPGDGKVCIQIEDREPVCFTPDELRPVPFLPEMLPLLPGYPPATPANDKPTTPKQSGAVSEW